MKIFSIRLAIAVLTFAVGVFSPILWFYYSYQPKVKLQPEADILTACDFTNHEVSESDKRFWNQEILGRFKEQPLEKTSVSIDESYRFTLLPTFDAPISIHLWRVNNHYFFNVRKLNGKGGFGIQKFGKLAYNTTRELSEDEWFKFTTLLHRSGFWVEPSLITEEVINDGAEWIMEGTRKDAESEAEYHEVHRILPNQEFRDSGNYLLKLAGFGKQYEGYYKEYLSS